MMSKHSSRRLSLQTDQNGHVAGLEEAAGRRQLGDGEACLHQAADYVLCIIVVDDREYHFHKRSPSFMRPETMISETCGSTAAVTPGMTTVISVYIIVPSFPDKFNVRPCNFLAGHSSGTPGG